MPSGQIQGKLNKEEKFFSISDSEDSQQLLSDGFLIHMQRIDSSADDDDLLIDQIIFYVVGPVLHSELKRYYLHLLDCWFVCQQDYTTTTARITMNLSGRMWYGSKRTDYILHHGAAGI